MFIFRSMPTENPREFSRLAGELATRDASAR